MPIVQFDTTVPRTHDLPALDAVFTVQYCDRVIYFYHTRPLVKYGTHNSVKLVLYLGDGFGMKVKHIISLRMTDL